MTKAKEINVILLQKNHDLGYGETSKCLPISRSVGNEAFYKKKVWILACLKISIYVVENQY